jgi:antitoxin VapB
LPAEFRFEGTEVDIRRDPTTGDVILSQSPKMFDVEAFIRMIETFRVPKDFMKDRHQPKDDLRDPFQDWRKDD